jgi:hypothetical protein
MRTHPSSIEIRGSAWVRAPGRGQCAKMRGKESRAFKRRTGEEVGPITGLAFRARPRDACAMATPTGSKIPPSSAGSQRGRISLVGVLVALAGTVLATVVGRATGAGWLPAVGLGIILGVELYLWARDEDKGWGDLGEGIRPNVRGPRVRSEPYAAPGCGEVVSEPPGQTSARRRPLDRLGSLPERCCSWTNCASPRGAAALVLRGRSSGET